MLIGLGIGLPPLGGLSRCGLSLIDMSPPPIYLLSHRSLTPALTPICRVTHLSMRKQDLAAVASQPATSLKSKISHRVLQQDMEWVGRRK